ncbi:MAG TPA: SDR family oxidoreductase [Burkholderiales bacterium]
MAKTAFVTGGTGFIGLNLVEQLIAAGWQVVALHRRGAMLRYLERFPVTLVEGDILDPASLARGIPPGVDAVFHVAGDTSMWSRRNAAQDRVNIDGTRHMVQAALAAGAGRFVYTSSISAYGLHLGRIDERAEQRGASSWINYQRSKYYGEVEVRRGIERGLDAVILNPASVFGPYDTASWARLIRLVCTGRLPGVPPGRLSFCHSREVAKAHIAAAERGRTGENYLLGGTDATLLELVQTIGAVAGCPVPVRTTPRSVLIAASRIAEWISWITRRPPSITPEMVGQSTREMTCDSTKAQRELGLQPVSLRRMVEDSVEWLRREGFLGRWTAAQAA